jgi:hypothetical protein
MPEVTVKFLNHANQRVEERGLNRDVIANLCEAAAPMLRINRALRFRVAGHVVVAQKRMGNIIEVVTAWNKKR